MSSFQDSETKVEAKAWKNMRGLRTIITLGSNPFVQGIILIGTGIITIFWSIGQAELLGTYGTVALQTDRWCPEGWYCTSSVTPWRGILGGLVLGLWGLGRLWEWLPEDEDGPPPYDWKNHM